MIRLVSPSEEEVLQRIGREHLMPCFDRRIPPAATVEAGEIFVVETEDSRGGLTRTPETSTPEYLVAIRKKGYVGNPVVGPVFIRSAEPAIHLPFIFTNRNAIRKATWAIGHGCSTWKTSSTSQVP